MGFQDGRRTRNDILVTRNRKDNIRHGAIVHHGTIHRVLAHDIRFGPKRGSQLSNFFLGTGNERGAGIDNGRNGAAVRIGTGRIRPGRDTVQGNLPIRGTQQFDIGQFIAFKLGRIVTAKRQFTRRIVTEVKTKNGLIHDVLGNGVFKDGRGSVNTDTGKAQTQNTIEFTQSIGHSQTTGVLNFTKPLARDNQIVRQADRFDREKARHGSGPVHDCKVGAVLLVSRTLVVVVLALLSKKGIAAVLAADLGDPEVGRARVKNDLKGLGRCPKRHDSKVLGIGVIVNDFGFLFQQGGRSVRGWQRRMTETLGRGGGGGLELTGPLVMRRHEFFVGTLVQLDRDRLGGSRDCRSGNDSSSSSEDGPERGCQDDKQPQQANA